MATSFRPHRCPSLSSTCVTCALPRSMTRPWTCPMLPSVAWTASPSVGLDLAERDGIVADLPHRVPAAGTCAAVEARAVTGAQAVVPPARRLFRAVTLQSRPPAGRPELRLRRRVELIKVSLRAVEPDPVRAGLGPLRQGQGRRAHAVPRLDHKVRDGASDQVHHHAGTAHHRLRRCRSDFSPCSNGSSAIATPSSSARRSGQPPTVRAGRQRRERLGGRRLSLSGRGSCYGSCATPRRPTVLLQSGSRCRSGACASPRRGCARPAGGARCPPPPGRSGRTRDAAAAIASLSRAARRPRAARAVGELVALLGRGHGKDAAGQAPGQALERPRPAPRRERGRVLDVEGGLDPHLPGMTDWPPGPDDQESRWRAVRQPCARPASPCRSSATPGSG